MMNSKVNTIFKLADVYNDEKINISREHEEKILGQIILNRIVGIAYDNLDINNINKETKKALDILKRENEIKFDCFLQQLKYVASLLENASFKFAFLKGAFLTPAIYERGDRTSNDIDILISKEDLSHLKEVLISSGFVQGHCDHAGNIIPADRKSIINANMNYGETVPFLRYYNGKIIEVDVNFSLDYKSKGNDAIVKELLNSSQLTKTKMFDIVTLSKPDFLIHLCCHLFKEATTYDWVMNRRDLMLYKFSDINVFINTYGKDGFLKSLSERIKHFGLEKQCYYALKNASIIYPRLLSILGYTCLLQEIKPNNVDFMKQIVYPKQQLLYEYGVSFEEWFNAPNRMDLLKKTNI